MRPKLAPIAAFVIAATLTLASETNTPASFTYAQVAHWDSAGTNALDGRGILQNPSILWMASLGDNLSAPSIESMGYLFAATKDGNVVAMDAVTGETRSSTRVEGTPRWIGVEPDSPGGMPRLVLLTKKEGMPFPEPSHSLAFRQGDTTVWEIKGCIIGTPAVYRDADAVSHVIFGYHPDCLDPSEGLASIQLDSGVMEWISNEDMPVTPPRVGDLDADGTAEIAFVTTSGRIVVLEGGGQVRWARNLNRGTLTTPIFADLDCDRKSELLVPLLPELTLSLPANLSVYDSTGDLIWWRTFPTPSPLWPVEIAAIAAGYLRSTLCRDVVVALSNSTVLSVSGADRKIHWIREGMGLSLLCADIDGNTLSDVVVLGGTTASALNGSSGAILWRLQISPLLEDAVATDVFREPGGDRILVSLQVGERIGVLGPGAAAPPPDLAPLAAALGIGAFLLLATWFALWYYRRRRRGAHLEERGRRQQ